jgi:hypothetical protein
MAHRIQRQFASVVTGTTATTATETSSKSNASKVKGHATLEGTKRFLEASGIPLQHYLDNARVMINPIIHGAPKRNGSMSQEVSEIGVGYAICANRSNCVYIYDYNPESTWFTANLRDMFAPENSDLGVSRDNIVTIANLGLGTTADVLECRLQDASDRTGIANIDIAVVEVYSLRTR